MSARNEPRVASAREDLRDVDLGDQRLNDRLGHLIAAWEAAPDRSLPEMLETDGQLEAAYRFLNNRRVTLEKLLAPHVDATAERARLVGSLLVLHDTTEFRFGGCSRRSGLGPIAMNGQGFFGHFALAIGDARNPLGVVGLTVIVRGSGVAKRSKSVTRTKRHSPESVRWAETIRASEERLRGLHPIHVMDREADDYELLHELVDKHWRFIVRVHEARQRKVSSVGRPITPLEDVAPRLRGVAKRDVAINPRAGKRGGLSEKIHPIRDRRTAKLEFRTGNVKLVPPRDSRRLPPLPIHVVHVAELDVPDGVEPISWTLYTTEAIETATDVLKVIDAYRSRWMIEEFFKALKTGCAIERRQLESREALLNALGVSIPIAARMLALRHLARTEPTTPAVNILSPVELDALRVIARRTPLPRAPTARDALLSIAGVGGHLKRNGDPGWLVIARGFETLAVAVHVVEVERTRRRR